MTSQLLFKLEEMFEAAKLDAFETAIQGIYNEESVSSMGEAVPGRVGSRVEACCCRDFTALFSCPKLQLVHLCPKLNW